MSWQSWRCFQCQRYVENGARGSDGSCVCFHCLGIVELKEQQPKERQRIEPRLFGSGENDKPRGTL